MKAKVIPKKIVEMAEAMKQAKAEGRQLLIIQSRNWGKTYAASLAATEDAEVVEQKELPPSK
jgi:hypothetical protein